MPKPGDAHKKLAALIGDWSGGETLHPSPWDPSGGSASARVVNRWVVDGFAVVQEYEQRRGGKVAFRGHGVFWFDAVKDQYVMHWWDSMGGAGGEYRGGFDGGVLTLGAAMPQGGQARTSFDLSQPGAYAFAMEVSPDGMRWQPAMTGKCRARPAKKTVAKKPERTVAKPKGAKKRR